MRRSPREEGLRWIEQAYADLHGARVLLDNRVFHLACSVAQQVAEKAVKAFLYAQGEEVVVGHSVTALCQWAVDFDSRFADLGDRISVLDGFYVPTRYPNGLPDSIPARVYTHGAASDAVQLAEEAVQFVESTLK